MKKFLFITLAAVGLSFLASSCVKEKGFEERVNEIVAAQLDSLNQQVAALEKTQTALNDSLKSIKGDVEKLSKQSKSLTDSISAVKDSLAAQKKWTTEQLNAIGVKITDIEKAQEEFMADVYARLGHLWNRIQKIDVVPQYSDGSVYVDYEDNVVNFIVRPDSVAQKLVKAHPAGDSTFTFLAVKTLTKSNMNADTLKISEVLYKDGVVSVKVNGSKLDSLYFKGEQSYSGCLVISDGNSNNTSGYFPLYYDNVRINLSKNGTSNCYIISGAGDYKFKATVKGNCKDSIITPSAVSVLWESFGTATAPGVGELVKDVTLAGNYVRFVASDKKGNAVIAVKDASGNILWSWHIWLTDQPEEQVYNNSAGTMMDRNLGATDTAKGSVGALGLLYQWGRKDPFLGSSAKNASTQAASTPDTWPTQAVQDNQSDNELNLKISIKNPTTFITCMGSTGSPVDWYCTNSYFRNDSLWKVSSVKTIYDPCPVGWRVPDGNTTGVWCKAFGKTESWKNKNNWDDNNKGMDFGTTDCKLVGTGSDQCWYPAAGYRRNGDGALTGVGGNGVYWSCATNVNDSYFLSFDYEPYVLKTATVSPAGKGGRATGRSVRCVKE